MQKYRIEGLSDLVFGLALSIGSLALINMDINDVDDILRGIFWFIIGFMIIVSVWMSYTKIMAERTVETELDLRLNLLLLMLVSLEPFLLYMLTLEDSANVRLSDFATMTYAIDIGLVMLVLGLFQHKIVSKGEGEINKRERNSHLVVASIFLISALPFFWDFTVFNTKGRYLMWMFIVVPTLYFKISGAMSRGKKAAEAK